MKRKKSETEKMKIFKVCRVCLTDEPNLLRSQSRFDALIDLLTGNKLPEGAGMGWLCYRCAHTIRKLSTFRDLCIRADQVIQEYDKKLGKNKIKLNIIETVKAKISISSEPTLSNILCLSVATTEEGFSNSSRAEAVSFIRDSSVSKNFTEDMVLVKLSEIKQENWNTAEEKPPIVPERKLNTIRSDVINENSDRMNEINDKINDNGDKMNDCWRSDDSLDLGEVKIEMEAGIDFFESTEERDIGGELMKEVTSSKKTKKLKKRRIDKSEQSSDTQGRKIKIRSRSTLDEGSSETVLSREQQEWEREERARDPAYVGAPFRCEACVLPFSQHHSLDKHMLKHSQDRGPFECEICTQRFPTKRTLRAHASLHALRLVCLACGQRVRDRARLKEHHEWHAGRTHSCHACHATFRRRTTLRNHVRLKHGQRQFRCEHCPQQFKSEDRLAQHLLRHSNIRPYVCSECGKAFYTRANLCAHRDTHSAARTHYCVECDAHFKSASTLRNHLVRSSAHKDPSTLRFPCGQCTRRYQSAELLRRHVLAAHERVPLYACVECGARYATRQGVNFHARAAHRGFVLPRKYACHACVKTFSSKALLTNHIRTHTGERPFECPQCQCKFTQKSTMRTHVRLVHLKVQRLVGRTKHAKVTDAGDKQVAELGNNQVADLGNDQIADGGNNQFAVLEDKQLGVLENKHIAVLENNQVADAGNNRVTDLGNNHIVVLKSDQGIGSESIKELI